MGTKQNPGPNDCYAKAQPDEPLFTLLARDPFAREAIAYWIHLRSGGGSFNALRLIQAAAIQNPKLVEARACIDEMRKWQRASAPPEHHFACPLEPTLKAGTWWCRRGEKHVTVGQCCNAPVSDEDIDNARKAHGG